MNKQQRLYYTQCIAKMTPEDELLLETITFPNKDTNEFSGFLKNKIKEKHLMKEILNFGTAPSIIINELSQYYLCLKTVKDKLDFLFILLLESCYDEIKNRNRDRIMECVVDRIFNKNQLIIANIIPPKDSLIYKVFTKAIGKTEEYYNFEEYDDENDYFMNADFEPDNDLSVEEDDIARDEAFNDRNSHHINIFKNNRDYYDKMYYYSDKSPYNLQFDVKTTLTIFYSNEKLESYFEENKDIHKYFNEVFNPVKIASSMFDEDECFMFFSQDFKNTENRIREDIEQISMNAI